MGKVVVVVHLPESETLTPGLSHADVHDVVMKVFLPALNQRNRDKHVFYLPSHSNNELVDIFPRKKEQ